MADLHWRAISRYLPLPGLLFRGASSLADGNLKIGDLLFDLRARQHLKAAHQGQLRAMPLNSNLYRICSAGEVVTKPHELGTDKSAAGCRHRRDNATTIAAYRLPDGR